MTAGHSTEIIRTPKQKYLRECFHYAALTTLIWRHDRPFNHFRDAATGLVNEKRWRTYHERIAGHEPSHVQTQGHVQLVLDGTEYLVQRIIWKWMVGHDYPGKLTFVDGNPMNWTWGNIVPLDIWKPQGI